MTDTINKTNNRLQGKIINIGGHLVNTECVNILITG